VLESGCFPYSVHSTPSKEHTKHGPCANKPEKGAKMTKKRNSLHRVGLNHQPPDCSPCKQGLTVRRASQLLNRELVLCAASRSRMELDLPPRWMLTNHQAIPELADIYNTVSDGFLALVACACLRYGVGESGDHVDCHQDR